MAFRLNPCEFNEADVDQFLEINGEYQNKFEEIDHSKLNKSKKKSAKFQELNPSQNRSYIHDQCGRERGRQDTREYSEDMNAEIFDPTQTVRKKKKRKHHQHITYPDEDSKFPQKRKHSSRHNELRKTKLYH